MLIRRGDPAELDPVLDGLLQVDSLVFVRPSLRAPRLPDEAHKLVQLKRVLAERNINNSLDYLQSMRRSRSSL